MCCLFSIVDLSKLEKVFIHSLNYKTLDVLWSSFVKTFGKTYGEDKNKTLHR
jgi:hypothetical protein